MTLIVLFIKRKVLQDLENARNGAHKLTQIRSQKESYVSITDYTILAYRLIMSLIAHYSKMLKLIGSNLDEIKKGA